MIEYITTIITDEAVESQFESGRGDILKLMIDFAIFNPIACESSGIFYSYDVTGAYISLKDNEKVRVLLRVQLLLPYK